MPDSRPNRVSGWITRLRTGDTYIRTSLLQDGPAPAPGPPGRVPGPEPVLPRPLQARQLPRPPSPYRPVPVRELNAPLVRKSMALISGSPAECARDFYSFLFSASPALRSMFPPQMSHQNERLFAALVRIVELLEDQDGLAAYLAQLGADHRKYGVEPEHYTAV